jgi:hypothetical protein
MSVTSIQKEIDKQRSKLSNQSPDDRVMTYEYIALLEKEIDTLLQKRKQLVRSKLFTIEQESHLFQLEQLYA